MYPANIKPMNCPTLCIVPTSVSFHRLSSQVKSHCVRIRERTSYRKCVSILNNPTNYLIEYRMLVRIVDPRTAFTSHVGERCLRTYARVIVPHHVTCTIGDLSVDFRRGNVDPRWLERRVFRMLAFRH